MKNNPTAIGICCICKKSECKITFIDELSPICDECLNYFGHCDRCGEYWSPEQVAFYHLKNGTVLCEHCAEGIDKQEVVYVDC